MFALLAVSMVSIVGYASLTLTRAATDSIAIEAEGSAVEPPPPPPPPTTGDMLVYHGSTHNHTGCCNDHGEADKATPTDIFNTAKQNGFDFLFLTEHTNPRSVSDPATIAGMGTNATTWFNTVKSLAVSTSTSSFVGFAGVETGDPGSNHMTIVNQEDFYFAEAPAANINYMVSQRNKGLPVFGNFNHPGAGGHGGSSASNINTVSREAMAFSGVQYGNSDSGRDGAGYSAYLVHLDRGWRVGPTCELDGHGKFRLVDWNESRIDTCRIGVLAPSLTRANLNDAFANRRFFVARDTNMEVRYTANGQWMGSKIGKPSSVNFDIDIKDPSTTRAVDKIKKVEIITEAGAVVATKTFDAHEVSWDISVPANGKKYFFVRIFNGEYTYQAAVTAPVWLE